MKQLLDGVWTWSVFDTARQVDFNGYHVTIGGWRALIDPVPFDAEAIERLGAPQAVIITNKDHRRASPQVGERWGAPILVHELDAPLLEGPFDDTFREGELLAGGLRVVHLADQKSPGECALHWAERRILFLGDALWGKPAGELTMLPAAKYRDPAKARAGLQRLADLEVDAVLMGDGVPILSGGGGVLRRTLASLR